MTRIQVLELPEGAGDERPPFVLVVDECAPRRIIIGMDHAPVRDYWAVAAEQMGARGVVVTAETVEIPANALLPFGESAERVDLADGINARAVEVESKFARWVDEQHHRDLGLMDRVTDALGVDRLRDWDEIVWAIENKLSAVRAENGGE
ncbi:hypothetical protein [Streptomyces sp. NPDC058657]|uniref:hypothetical protein n=1 Tax=unclassified Streptomyces TaxID=2593676 RepID=UPI00365F8ADD